MGASGALEKIFFAKNNRAERKVSAGKDRGERKVSARKGRDERKVSAGKGRAEREVYPQEKAGVRGSSIKKLVRLWLSSACL